MPPTHRLAYDETTGKYVILYTDLSEGGKHAVWSISNSFQKLLDMNITQGEFAQLSRDLQQTADCASFVNHILSDDAYFIRRKDNGELDVAIGDIGMGVYNSSAEGARKGNEISINKFLNQLKSSVLTY